MAQTCTEREPAHNKQSWTASHYGQHARYVSQLGDTIFGWLDPKRGERIMDIGCGDGHLTTRIVQAGAEVLGVDTSDDMLARARERGLDVRSIDAQALTFEGEFHAVFSNATLHWMLKSERVIQGVATSLHGGGRFVAEFGGHGNLAAIVTAIRAAAKQFDGDEALAGPWFFPTPEEYGQLLESEGFVIERMELVPRRTPLPTGMEGWLQTFSKPFFDQFDEPVRSEAIEYVIELLRPSLCDAHGQWVADYVRLRVAARLKTD
jgi:trans-aconitate methyltransferase